ncbi:unnamed protein product [Bursaphelenchus xylophilus]|uniref:Phosphatidylinositol-glycan biosynthesis class X protein n=1 Tax=Bursaphelenchus xylophilus TaxID=6326 RepID=A0A1I7SMK6_BURXY|nr:unnamed protein product [Bursaphelenchus xylophilus]CAG9130265.1 unnamed protein product [Bursaphelenchus xylophilus]
MRNYLFGLLILVFNDVNACQTIKLDLSSKLTGDGFHRTIYVSAEVSSMKRLTECNLAYFFQIPKGIFVQTESLNGTLFNHCYLTSQWNLEDLSDSVAVTDLKPLIFYSTKEPRKVFVFKDEFKFNVHFRYNPAKLPEEELPIVEIGPPRVYLRCKENETLLEDKSCFKNRENLACGCQATPKCSFIRLTPSNSTPKQKATVPAGDKSEAKWVVTLTLVSLFICLLIISMSKPHVVKEKDD